MTLDRRYTGEPSNVEGTGEPGHWAAPAYPGALPMKIVMSYLLLTFVLFLIWPINWPIYHLGQWLLLAAYVALCFSVLASMFLFGIRRPTAFPPSGSPRRTIILGAILAIVLLIPSSYFYTGQMPWNVLEALQQQGDAYRRFQEQLSATSGQRGLISIVRAFAAPLTFAVLPLGIIYWRTLSWTFRGLVIATVGCALIFGILRGTDREMAEMLMVAGSALLVTVARTSRIPVTIAIVLRQYWKAVVLAILFFIAAAFLFTDRKAERLGQTHTVCANDSQICADLNAPAVAWMGERANFSTSIFILSSCSGYYGLALGMEKDFRSTFGVGHSAFTLTAYEQLTGDDSLRHRTYTQRNFFDGWSPEFYWSTAILWIANDVGFIGAVIVLGLVAFAWGRSWRDATYGHNDGAAVIFCIIMLAMFQLPSTNAALNALDGYLTILTWSILWIRGRRASRPAGAGYGLARLERSPVA